MAPAIRQRGRSSAGADDPKFWPNVEGSGNYPNGLAFLRKVWASPKVMYAASPVQGGAGAAHALRLTVSH